MAEAAELAKLHDIHLPAAIGWWPMAAGWYFLVLIACLFLLLIIYLAHRSHNNKRAKYEALQLLKHYEQDYQQEANCQLTSMKVSELLRRVALAYFPRKEVASLKDEAWLAFLTKTSKGIDFNALRDYFIVLPYQSAKELDLQPLFHSVKQWIKQRGKPCSN